jgi:phosphohistidine phosphatase
VRSLTLLRHAKSSWDDESIDDFHRPLNDRGWRSARAMGEYLRSHGARFDLIIASEAERVVQTLRGLAEGGWQSGPVQFDTGIYHAGYRDLLALIQKTPDEVRRLMVVGHNPTIGAIAAQLSRNGGEEVLGKYPTGALAQIDLDVEHWSDVEPNSGQLTAFGTPRSLDKG